MNNMSGMDRSFRVIIGIAFVLLSWAVGFGSALGIVLLVVAAILLLTGAVGMCPLYRLLGISTNHTVSHMHR